MRLAGYVTVTLMTFDKQSSGRRIESQLNPTHSCNHRAINA